MGYMYMLTECVRCNTTFGCNPDLVPSIRLTPAQEKEPICADCVRDMQRLQKQLGLEVWPDPLSGAYDPVDLNGPEPIPEDELDPELDDEANYQMDEESWFEHMREAEADRRFSEARESDYDPFEDDKQFDKNYRDIN